MSAFRDWFNKIPVSCQRQFECKSHEPIVTGQETFARLAEHVPDGRTVEMGIVDAINSKFCSRTGKVEFLAEFHTFIDEFCPLY